MNREEATRVRNKVATILGLPVIGREAGRHVFFRVGAANVLLVFNADATLAGGMLPPHGTRGPGTSPSAYRPRRWMRGGIISPRAALRLKRK